MNKYLGIIEKNKCIGCNLCATVCKKNAITLTEDEEGFLYPLLNEDNCIHCKLCIQNCPQIIFPTVINDSMHSFAFSLSDKTEIMESASGGAVTALARSILDKGGSIYCLGYTKDYLDGVFTLSSSYEDFSKKKSSVYFETQPMDYDFIKNILNINKNTLMVVGLPCQIGALKKYLTTDYTNLLCVSLVCAGRDSRIVGRNMINYLRKKYNSDITSYNYRFKKKSWNQSYLKATFANGKKFLGEEPLLLRVSRPSCYNCNYKLNSNPSDIIVGDFWGVEQFGKKLYNKLGTSVVVAKTEKGNEYLKKVSKYGNLTEVSLDTVYKTNEAFIKSKIPDKKRQQIIKLLSKYDNMKIALICDGVFSTFFNKVKKILKTYMPTWFVIVGKRLKHRI